VTIKETGRYGVEAYLKKQVAADGGSTRKFVSPGRRGVPDQIVIWPRRVTGPVSKGVRVKLPRALVLAEIHLAELKAPGGVPEPHQAREHARLRKLGVQIFVLDTKPKVDAYVKAHRS
jgi:hypothetical protein